ncbi:hypothetical protein O1611_g7068 [Lasiodiplodia mahajangana]|uniref:Uncharacterized protein n=1 Tax=Lasiodiplodia mahajangana TaxID=1108764 RepID=A0ACC2JGS9_9PEZI|nr:hypothetical protein O1611_g7068 [Lasiodiplodia mahajangana]
MTLRKRLQLTAVFATGFLIVENNIAIAVGSTPAFCAFTRVYIKNSSHLRSFVSLISGGHWDGGNSNQGHSDSGKPVSILTWGRWRSARPPARAELDTTQPWGYDLSETALNTSVSAYRTETLADEEATGITMTTEINQVSKQDRVNT